MAKHYRFGLQVWADPLSTGFGLPITFICTSGLVALGTSSLCALEVGFALRIVHSALLVTQCISAIQKINTSSIETFHLEPDLPVGEVLQAKCLL